MPILPRVADHGRGVYTADRERFPPGPSRIRAIGAQTYNYLLYVNSDSQIYGVERAYLEEMAAMRKDRMVG